MERMSRNKTGIFGVALESIWRRSRNEESAVTRHERANHDLIFGSGSVEKDSGDEMGDFINGDLTQHHYHQQPTEKKNSGVLKTLAIAALAAGTGGLGFAAPFVLDLMKNKPNPTEPIENIDTDTDTVFELSIPD